MFIAVDRRAMKGSSLPNVRVECEEFEAGPPPLKTPSSRGYSYISRLVASRALKMYSAKKGYVVFL